MVYKQNEWTEEALLALSTEDDRFDKKSGQIFPGGYKAKIAQAASAFANSNGGYIILGMYDDKEVAKNGGRHFDGVDFKHKQISFAEWLDDQMSGILNPPIQSYRVLPVKPKLIGSEIPPDKPVYVIEIDASEIAPHQSSVDNVYYYREGNDSKPANHYYLEGLRSVRRFVSPILVRAWLDTFLIQLDDYFKKAVSFYKVRDFYPVINDSSLMHLRQISITPIYYSLDDILANLNALQFMRRYPLFKNQFTHYKVLSAKFNSKTTELRDQIAQSSELKNFIFNEFINGPDFMELLNMTGLTIQYDKPENRRMRLFELFSLHPSWPDTDLLDFIASAATYETLSLTSVNSKAQGLDTSGSAMNFIRVWTKISSGMFGAVFKVETIKTAKENCELILKEIQDFLDKLSYDLDNEIDLLTSRSGVPYSAVR